MHKYAPKQEHILERESLSVLDQSAWHTEKAAISLSVSLGSIPWKRILTFSWS